MAVASDSFTSTTATVEKTTQTVHSNPTIINTQPLLSKASLFPIHYPHSATSFLSARSPAAIVPYPTPDGTTNLHIKRKKAKDATSVGGSTAIARTLMLQGLYLFYRTPVKLFRPLRIDYLIMARALLPIDEASKRFSFRYTSIGMITHAVKTRGWSFLPKHVFPPLIANTVIGTVLYTTYIATLPLFHPPSAYQLHRPFPPPPYSSVFLAGCLAGAAQSIIATPIDSLKVRFEVNDLLEGKHRSLYQFAKTTLKDLGIASAYRGFTLTLLRDSLACGLFFATFEWVKQQGYYYYLDEMYGLHVVSSKTLQDLEISWKEQVNDLIHHHPTKDPLNDQTITTIKKERPPLMLEPIFVILAGAAAAVAYQLIDHPFAKIHSIFYIEEGQSEFTHKSKREPVNVLYRRTWEQCQRQVKLNGGSWIKFLYQEFGSTVLKVVPATSVGFLVFELVKREVDFRSMKFEPFQSSTISDE
ncbi:mitochondrial carrier domain-containing protein [Halteromyces radiatus]|uniref:mitochondrial carrier domain-containing protein n=1 Tax=Halteromyces radiatus TaxID=101107 RepID=UPI002220F204|nr:mitochondrial carrier domain-containing protein [Halteromyces radiatus]KAI8082863.1 mitochondrial carrier domain-containing protein [Halteromyces radiatus]